MAHECPAVASDLTLKRLMHDHVLGAGRRCFGVVEGGRLQGLFTLHEVKAVPRERWGGVRVADVMRPIQALVTANPEEDLLRALERLDVARSAQMPIMSDGHWLGMLDREDILHYVRARTELGGVTGPPSDWGTIAPEAPPGRSANYLISGHFIRSPPLAPALLSFSTRAPLVARAAERRGSWMVQAVRDQWVIILGVVVMVAALIVIWRTRRRP